MRSNMFTWLNKDSKKENVAEVFDNVTQGLNKCYTTKLKPLENAYKFHDFHSPPLEEADFEAKPLILLIGQYSTGKTTFIRYLIEQDFPGMRIGPEPTTDRFIVVMNGDQESVIPGNALVMDPKKQFRQLSKFGNNFLNRLQCSQVPNKVLQSITIVDTPGILSGEKQRVDRGYDFGGVIEWLAERVDRIILLFDAHKLDISDEFRRVIEAMKGYDDKIRIVLNKSDMIDSQQLMRVYGALMWSLGKVLNTPEVSRVYIGSFWSKPLHYDSNRRLFELESQDLFNDMQSLPKNAALRKLNDLIKRARLAKVHAYIIAHLKKEMPSMFGKDTKKKELIKNLPQIFESLQREHNISPGDFPNVQRFQQNLENCDFSKFNLIKQKLIDNVDDMMRLDIAELMKKIPKEEKLTFNDGPAVQGGAFEDITSPFQAGYGEGVDRGRDTGRWIVEEKKQDYMELFNRLGPVDGKITGALAKQEMVKSRLPNNILGRIWKLSDIDKDGMLDEDEFALAQHLIEVTLGDNELPSSLPPHLIPPSKRGMLH